MLRKIDIFVTNLCFQSVGIVQFDGDLRDNLAYSIIFFFGLSMLPCLRTAQRLLLMEHQMSRGI